MIKKILTTLLWWNTKVTINNTIVSFDGEKVGSLTAVLNSCNRVCREHTGQEFDVVVNNYTYKAYLGGRYVGIYDTEMMAAKAIFFKINLIEDKKSKERAQFFQFIAKKY